MTPLLDYYNISCKVIKTCQVKQEDHGYKLGLEFRVQILQVNKSYYKIDSNSIRQVS